MPKPEPNAPPLPCGCDPEAVDEPVWVTGYTVEQLGVGMRLAQCKQCKLVIQINPTHKPQQRSGLVLPGGGRIR